MAMIERVRPSARIVWMLVLVWPILGVAILVVAVVATQVSCMMRKEAKEEKNATLVAKDTKNNSDLMKIISRSTSQNVSLYI